MNQVKFCSFDEDWGEMLREFRIESLHMTDFSSAHGRYSTMFPEMKKALFSTAANLINSHKEYSITIAIPQAEFKQLLSMEIYKKLIGPYAMAFMIVAMFNSEIAEDPRIISPNFTRRMAYLADKGSKHHHDQIDAAHTTIINWEKANGRARTGTLAFDFDERVSALQASDALAWTYHCQQEYGGVADEFTPLLEMFRDQVSYTGEKRRFHLSLPVPRDGVALLADGINNWITNKGKMPARLSEMISI